MKVRDDAPGQAPFELEVELGLEPGLDSAEVTVAELIRGRVTAELLAQGQQPSRPLIDVTPDERALNGLRPDPGPVIEREARRAEEAFIKGRFLLVVDGRKLERLDQRFELTPDTEVTFLRLVPLAGG